MDIKIEFENLEGDISSFFLSQPDIMVHLSEKQKKKKYETFSAFPTSLDQNKEQSISDKNLEKITEALQESLS